MICFFSLFFFTFYIDNTNTNTDWDYVLRMYVSYVCAFATFRYAFCCFFSVYVCYALPVLWTLTTLTLKLNKILSCMVCMRTAYMHLSILPHGIILFQMKCKIVQNRSFLYTDHHSVSQEEICTNEKCDQINLYRNILAIEIS